MILGSHVGMSGKKMLVGSVEDALSYGANCFMIYTGAPQNTLRKKISECNVPEAHELMKKHNINFDHIVVHAPYIVNMGNAEPDKANFTVKFLTEEVKRTHALGFKYLVVHPGAARGESVEIGLHNIVRCLDKITDNTTDTDVMILLETMSGKGTELGVNFDEISEIIKRCKNPERIGVCMDTCHMHDYGYDVKENFDHVLQEFDEKVGLDKLKCIHLNDSMNLKGARKDRHANLGYGEIGFDTLNYIVRHPKLENIPKILETPYIPLSANHKDRALCPYKEEIDMLKDGKFNKHLFEDIRKETSKDTLFDL